MLLHDTVVLDGVRRTRDGYLVGRAKIARTGIQTYSAGELGLQDRAPTDAIRVYRPPAAVFDSAAMAGMAHRPITNDHPTTNVTADNWKQLAVGFVGGDIASDGKFVTVPLALMDAQAIKDWDAGKRELSVGYQCELKMQDGTTPEGEAYDAVQDQIQPNHLALCWKARGGPELRLDHQPTGERTMALKNILVDGLMVETTDAGEAAINKLKGLLDSSAKALTDANTAHATALAAKDTELATKDAEITALKAKVVDGAALDAMVADRATVVAKAKAIAPTLDCAGKSNMDIKRAALGDAAKDKSDAYVDAAFDLKTDGVKLADPIRDAVKNGLANLGDAEKGVNDAKEARRQHMASAYRGESAKTAA